MSGGTSAEGAGDAEVEAWLRAGAGGPIACDRVVETSISRLFFFPGRVLKLKKRVDFGFVDFTTLERRRWAAERELAFNRITSASLYRRVLTLRRGSDGAITTEVAGEVVDVAVEMRRFDEGAILSRRPPLDGAFAESLGRGVARLHLAAAPGSAGAGAAGLAYVLDSNAQQLRLHARELGSVDVEALVAASGAALARARERLDTRAAEGFCRACHGDLHLANIIVENGAPLLFDCIEFSDRLREIDVGYDIAFLIMDLAFRGGSEAANRVLNGWLDEAARGLPLSIWGGLAALPLFLSVRASVRAHVCAREDKLEEARRYLAAAMSHLAPSAPRLIAVGGLSGTGKTTWARRVAPGLGGPPGAVVLRSDEVRKRLWNRPANERLPPTAYDAQASSAVYAELAGAAEAVLRAGRSVVVDAAFLEPARRQAIEALAAACAVPFEGTWLEAPADVLRERVAGRTGDASDADLAVLEGQLGRDPGEIRWRRG
jgi:aminoglycoside phosphotransferase family enzyme/predicted kinase